MPTLKERIDKLEARVNALENPEAEKAGEDDWEKSYLAHVQEVEAKKRADLIRRTKTGMQSTSSGP